jgi:hypothetical protein
VDITVGQLIAALEEFDESTPVRLAVQPSWPFEHRISSEVVEADGIIYLAEAGQVGYLPGEAAEAVGWS